VARIGLAFRAFFRTLKDAGFAERLVPLLEVGERPLPVALPKPEAKAPEKKKPSRSDALSLLAILQREARFVDFVKESLTSYSDAQIGAAVRDVHRDCGTVIERAFGLRPIVAQEEGAPVEIAGEQFDAARYRFTGKVPTNPPFRGSLSHHGWEAERCLLPDWTGNEHAARVIAQAVVELT
jgi:hypothetical protein